MVILISYIDRFDAQWETLKSRESDLLANMSVQKYIFSSAREEFIEDLDNCPYNIKTSISFEFHQLVFWYETDLEVHPLVRCIFFAYHLRAVLQLASLDVSHSVKMLYLLLFETGYCWIGCPNLDHIETLNFSDINNWTVSVLSMIRDGQQALLAKIDLYGTKGRLTTSEKLLLHVIDSHTDITTYRIAKKIGKSEATVRRMLSKLRALKLITTHGTGPRIFHRIFL